MTRRIEVRGTELRYVLTWYLFMEDRPVTVDELVAALDYYGFCVQGRPSKAISDALRWEMGRGRVCRRARGSYQAVAMPRSTEHRIVNRVAALRAQVAEVSRKGGQSGPRLFPRAE